MSDQPTTEETAEKPIEQAITAVTLVMGANVLPQQMLALLENRLNITISLVERPDGQMHFHLVGRVSGLEMLRGVLAMLTEAIQSDEAKIAEGNAHTISTDGLSDIVTEAIKAKRAEAGL